MSIETKILSTFETLVTLSVRSGPHMKGQTKSGPKITCQVTLVLLTFIFYFLKALNSIPVLVLLLIFTEIFLKCDVVCQAREEIINSLQCTCLIERHYKYNENNLENMNGRDVLQSHSCKWK